MAVSRIDEAGLNVTQYGNRNLIINGAMTVAQRGTSFTLNSSDAYTLDRWRSQGTYDAEVLTVEQSTDAPDGFGNSLKVTVSTAEATADADDYHIITQKLEGQDLQKLDFGASSAKALSFSFWVKASIAQTYAISLYQTNGNKHYSATYTVNAADTWEYKTVSITGNTANGLANDNSQGFEIAFMLGAGTTYTSGSNGAWGGAANFGVGASHTFMTTANATFQITGVQLEVGDTATGFEHRSYGDELQRCKRYYERFDNGTAAYLPLGMAWGSNEVRWVQTYTEKRTAPSISTTGSIRVYKAGGTNVLFTSPNTDQINTKSVLLYKTVSGLSATAGDVLQFINNSGVYQEYDAEL